MKPLLSTLITATALFMASLPLMGCGGKDSPGNIPDYNPPAEKKILDI